jgi:hypothetical protein
MALKAWKIADDELRKLPPYLKDDEMTAERYYEAHKDMLSNIQDARMFLEALVESGRLKKEERRNKNKSGSRPVVYVVQTTRDE